MSIKRVAPRTTRGPKPDLSAVIPARGESRRMGRDKALVEFDGKSLLILAVDEVQDAGIEGIFISGRPGRDYSTPNRPVLFDLEPGHVPMGGSNAGRCDEIHLTTYGAGLTLPHVEDEVASHDTARLLIAAGRSQ